MPVMCHWLPARQPAGVTTWKIFLVSVTGPGLCSSGGSAVLAMRLLPPFSCLLA